jgi:hypothetical protein
MTDKPKLNVIDMPQSADELDKLLAESERKLPAYTRLMKAAARELKIRYDAYVAEGFSRPEALALICATLKP